MVKIIAIRCCVLTKNIGNPLVEFEQGLFTKAMQVPVREQHFASLYLSNTRSIKGNKLCYFGLIENQFQNYEKFSQTSSSNCTIVETRLFLFRFLVFLKYYKN